jgi:eukaryotic-like serine/threonine-protein kinase
LKALAGAATLLALLALAVYALQGTAGYRLALVDRQGYKQFVGTLPEETFAPRLSPDGKQVAYDASGVSGTSVFIYSLASRTSRRLTTMDAHYPMWSADGQWILYTSGAQGEPAIFRQRADGTGQPERLTSPARAPESWSTPNQALSFITLTGGDYDIWVYSFKDRMASVLYRIPGSAQHSSSISPDGRWVAYMSDEKGREDVWVQAFPATASKVLVTRMSGGTRPLWSSDGKELFFDDGKQLFVAPVIRTEPAFETGDPRPLPISGFEQGPLRRQYDITADGKFLMMFP